MEENDWTPDPHILEVVKTELDRLRGVIEFKEPSGDKYEQWTKTIEANPYPLGCARLRLDFELVEDVDDRGEALKLMFDFIALDLTDLLENGDSEDYSNPFFAAYDGAKKRGKKLESISIPSAVLYREHKPFKQSYEYTMYLLLTSEWS